MMVSEDFCMVRLAPLSFRPLALCLAGALALTPFARAQPTSLEERVLALEKQLAALAAENKALREKQDAAAKPAPLVTFAGKQSRFSIGGFIQAHGEVGDAPDSRYAGVQDRFMIRRARVTFRGNFSNDWAMRLESDFGANTLGSTNGYRAQITDAFVEWTAHPAAQVRLGQFKTPFGWEQLMSDTQNPFVERPLANDRLTVGRQIGAALSGTVAEKRVEYSVGAYNGNGVNNSNNDNSAFMTAARVGVKAWNGQIGGKPASWSVATNAFTSRDSGTFTGQRDGLGFDTQFAAGPLTLRAEWLQNKIGPTVGASLKSDGWYFIALYDLNPTWQIATRYETFDSNTALPSTETDSLIFGVNYRILGNDLILSLHYMLGNADLGGADDRLLARFQVMF